MSLISTILVGLMIAGFCGVLFCFYMILRNEWVCRRRKELIRWHFSAIQADEIEHGSFDRTYGSYDEWMSIHNCLVWSPEKLAGLDRWYPAEQVPA